MIITQYEKFDVDHMPITIEFPTLDEAKLDAARLMTIHDVRYVKIIQNDILLYSACRYRGEGNFRVQDHLAEAAVIASLNGKYGKLGNPAPWEPMDDKLAIKHLGKLGEECTELGTAIFRCLIQGIDAREPVTGKPNREWLLEEIADVLANINLVRRHFDLNDTAIHDRVIQKYDHLTKWHGMK